MIGTTYKGLVVQDYWRKSNGDLELLCLNLTTGKRVTITQEQKYYGQIRNIRKRVSNRGWSGFC